jgi:DNA modification methylase
MLSDISYQAVKDEQATKIRHKVYGGAYINNSNSASSYCKKNGCKLKKNKTQFNLNTICPYYTMFPLEFPLRIMKSASISDWVLDPFCGRGTTLYAARLLGVGSVGLDSNPVAAAISSAKLVDTNAHQVIALLKAILKEYRKSFMIPEGEFWAKCYHPKTLHDLCAIRDYLIKSCSQPEEIMLRAIMLGILHGPLRKGKPTYLSNQMPRTFSTKPEPALRYWRNKGLEDPPYVDVLETVERRVLFSINSMPSISAGQVYCGDSRVTEHIIGDRYKFNWVITSPPYVGMRSYRSDQWLRDWFLGGAETVQYIQDGQIAHTQEGFVADLTQVWRSVAKVCSPGARLIIRFGSLPSSPVDAAAILKKTLHGAACGWKILTRKSAGTANCGRRQATQFKQKDNDPMPEFDLHARLEV